MLSLWIMLLPVVMVCVIALAMAICSSSLSATQFAIYMSVANLGYSAGSKLYGLVAEQSSYVENYTLLSLLVAAMILVLFFHRHAPDHGDGEKRRSSRYTVSLAGGEGGMFWSGAMRCPKCRCDMDRERYQGVEIDRCTRCQGLWFDAGEVELLRNAEAAAALDAGDAAAGRAHNTIDRYPCPRCHGAMIRMVDPQQRHIWFEQCSACSGSFFDAGEFRDLAQLTLSEFFKGIFAPERK